MVNPSAKAVSACPDGSSPSANVAAQKKRQMIRDRIISEFNPVIEAIKSTLERTPPEISSDIMKNGIILTGGSSLIAGIDDIIEDGVGMSVSVAKDCRDSVINGLGRIIEEKYIIEQ